MTDKSLDNVHHIALPVADIEKSVQWYTTSFCCSVEFQDATRAMLRFQNIRLQLLLPSQTPQHIAFERIDADTFGELRLGKEGLLSTYVSDPTGNPVEIIKPS